MRTMWALFTGDIRRLTSNTVSIIVVIGLIVIPGLFTWFNLIASWDPFGNTGNLKFAVANDDAGYRSELIPITVNVGDQLVNSLRANSQLDWTFTSSEEAVEGTRSGKYYAAVVIPQNFSENMLTFFTESEHATLTYYNNEKTNALAPLITGQGADAVATEINATFSQTLTETALDISSQLVERIETPESQDSLNRLNTQIGNAANTLAHAAVTLRSYSTIVESSQAIMDSTSTMLTNVRTSARDARTELSHAENSLTDISSAVDTSLSALDDALRDARDGYQSVAANADALLNSTSNTATSTATTLHHLADSVTSHAEHLTSIRDSLRQLRDVVATESQQATNPADVLALNLALQRIDSALTRFDGTIDTLNSLSSALTSAATRIETNQTLAEQDRETIRNLITTAREALTGLRSDFNESIRPQLAAIADSAASAAAGFSSGALTLRHSLTDVSTTSSSVKDRLGETKTFLTSLADELDSSAAQLTSFHEKFTQALISSDANELKELLDGDHRNFANVVASPVTVETHAIFPVENFGSQMAPFYTFIPLWVGALLLAATLKPTVSRETRRELGDPKPHQLYVGHYGIFALLAFAQATFSLGGSLLFLRVQAVHPWLFMLSGWVSALVYSLILYTLVVSFGNVGKALGVLLLVIQITGSGGTYPLQMLPDSITALSPFLPITHSIDAIRAAIAGIYEADYWVALGKLLLFTPPMLILGLVLRRPLITFNRWCVEKIEGTKILS